MITVSRAINTPQQVSERTRARVQEAVSALGYVPNLVAGGLRSARSHVVTALVPTLTGPLFGEMVQALTDALELRGSQVMVGQVGHARSREDALLRAIVGRAARWDLAHRGHAFARRTALADGLGHCGG